MKIRMKRMKRMKIRGDDDEESSGDYNSPQRS